MYIQFTKTTPTAFPKAEGDPNVQAHPDSAVLEYEAGKFYQLPKTEATHYITTQAAQRLYTQSEHASAAQQKVENIQKELNAIRNKERAKNDLMIKSLMTSLGLTAQPGKTIELVHLTQEEQELFENKQVVKDMQAYFKDKTEAVGEVAKLLVKLLNHAIDTKDNTLITRVSRDLSILSKLVQAWEEVHQNEF